MNSTSCRIVSKTCEVLGFEHGHMGTCICLRESDTCVFFFKSHCLYDLEDQKTCQKLSQSYKSAMYRSHFSVECESSHSCWQVLYTTCCASVFTCYISTCRLPTNRLSWRPVMSPATTCHSMRPLQSCRALAWHEVGTAQWELTHKAQVVKQESFFLLIFAGGVVKLLGSGCPQSSRKTC